jgi:hypothetical protein
VTVAVLGSEAEGFSAEQVVFEVLDALRDDDQRIEVAVRAWGTALE